MTHASKKKWTTPKLRRFDTPDEAAAFCEKASESEQERLDELIEQMRDLSRHRHPQTRSQRSTKG